MLFPLSDDDRALSGHAYVTTALVVINVVVFGLLQQLGTDTIFTAGYSVIPFEITNGTDLVSPETIMIGGERVTIPQAPGPNPIYLTILSAMFMHAGFAHLFGNMLYLWIFGDNLEHRFGALPFLLFYLVSGFAATAVQIALNPSGIIPNLGASGAISGVLGAYLMLFPRNRVKAIFLFTIVSVPAVLALGLWIAFQVFQGFGSLGADVGGVAYGAHIGGFFAGVLLSLLWRRKHIEHENVFTRTDVTDGSRRYW